MGGLPFSSAGAAKARAESENGLETMSEGTARGMAEGTRTRIGREDIEMVRESLETFRTAWRARRLLIAERVVGRKTVGSIAAFIQVHLFHPYNQEYGDMTIPFFYVQEIRT